MSMRFAAALGLALALIQPASAQDQQPAPEKAPSERIEEAQERQFDPAHLELAEQVIEAARVSREFDNILPNVADQAKTTFIRSNPQMQLGIIEVVDRVALEMVDNRAELDEVFAKIWASAFTQEELQALLEFYRSPVGEKFAERLPRVLAVQIGMAERWQQAISQELYGRVRNELESKADAEAMQLQDSAAPQQGAAPAPQDGGAAGQ